MADSLVKYLRNKTNSDSEMDDYQRLEMDAIHMNASSKLALIDDDDDSLALSLVPTNSNNAECSTSVTREQRNACCARSWYTDIRFFTVVLFFLSAADAVFWYATTGILSSVERRYSFSSGSMGLLYMMPEFGRLTILLFISHFGNRFNKAKVIAVFFTLASICIGLMAVPHFTIEYHPNTLSKIQSNLLCRPLGSSEQLASTTAPNRTIVDNDAAERRHSSQVAFTIISVVFFFFGMAESPMESLGTTYLVDNSHGTKSTFYVAMVESGWSIGPFLGMLLSAWTTSIYVEITESTTLMPSDPSWVGAWWLALLICAFLLFLPCPFLWYFPHEMKVDKSKKLSSTESKRNIDVDSVIPPSTDFLVRRLSDDNDELNAPVFQNHYTIPGDIGPSEVTNTESNLESQSSSVLGNGDVVTLHSTGNQTTDIIPTTSEAYHRHVEDVHETDIDMSEPILATDPHDEMDEAEDTRVIHKEMKRELYNCTGMLKSLARVLSNPAFVWLVIGLAFRSFSGWGLESFFPKYLEVQFSIPEWEASVMAGVMMGLAYGSARVLSGCLVHITKMSLRRSFFWCVLLTLLSSLLGATNMILGCDRPDIYDYRSNASYIENGSVVLVERCFESCGCSDTVYSPVCDVDITYYSPCYASCHTTNNETGKQLSYMGCACTTTGHATAGECENGCNMLVPFSIVTIAAFCMIAYTSPQLIVFTTRCIEKRDRALGFAVSICSMSFFGWLPAPYINGLLVDSACSVWEIIGLNDDATQGSCWRYNLADLRLRLHGLNAACRLCQFICFCLVYYYSRDKFEKWERESDDDTECLPEREEHQTLLDATDSS